jgi:hypothetical protein
MVPSRRARNVRRRAGKIRHRRRRPPVLRGLARWHYRCSELSDDWGVGAVAQLAYGQAADKELAGETWRSTSLSVLFSATYN